MNDDDEDLTPEEKAFADRGLPTIGTETLIILSNDELMRRK